MINLTEEEKLKVQKRKKSDKELPKYYDATLRKEIQISRDFEAFLILAPEELKTRALDWIKRVEKLQSVKKDRDALTLLVLKQEVSNTILKLDTLEGKMEGYNKFREQFQTMTEFSTIPEVTRFIQDLQRVIPELSMERSRAFFDQTVAVVEDARNKLKGEISQENLTQLQSWSNVIASYF